MPAYLSEISRFQCVQAWCDRFARYELRNNQNGLIGRFCTTCGKRRLKELKKQENDSRRLIL